MIAIHNLYVYNVLLIYNQCVYKFYNSDEPFRRRSIDLPGAKVVIPTLKLSGLGYK